MSPAGNHVQARAVLLVLPGGRSERRGWEVRCLAGRQPCAGSGGLAGASWAGPGTVIGRCVAGPAGSTRRAAPPGSCQCRRPAQRRPGFMERHGPYPHGNVVEPRVRPGQPGKPQRQSARSFGGRGVLTR